MKKEKKSVGFILYNPWEIKLERHELYSLIEKHGANKAKKFFLTKLGEFWDDLLTSDDDVKVYDIWEDNLKNL